MRGQLRGGFGRAPIWLGAWFGLDFYRGKKPAASNGRGLRLAMMLFPTSASQVDALAWCFRTTNVRENQGLTHWRARALAGQGVRKCPKPEPITPEAPHRISPESMVSHRVLIPRLLESLKPSPSRPKLLGWCRKP